MAYTKTVWVDRVVATAKRYLLTLISGTTYDIDAVPGTVTEAGTTVTAARMNNIEQGVYDAYNGAYLKALLTTKGDIPHATAANTPERLGIGTADKALKVNAAGDDIEYGNVSKSGTFDSTTEITASSDYVLNVALGVTAKTGHVMVSGNGGGIHGCSVIVTNTATDAISICTVITSFIANMGHNGSLSGAYFGTGGVDIYLKSAVITGTNLVLTFHNNNVANKNLAIIGTYAVAC